jgi:hypothetical protein
VVNGGWLGGIADVWIYGNVPLPRQPFGDVEPISVLPAPPAQFGRVDIRLLREVQVTDLQFKFSGEDRGGRNETPPVGIAAFAMYMLD